jgi:ferric-dicitrate binding protein FerR (iron transport regulator)
MNDDYLWDRTGTPDPEVERLERVLAPLRYQHRALPLPRAPHSRRAAWAIAAAVTAAASLVLMVAPPPQDTAWQLAGARLRKGQVVRTGNLAVTLEAESVGRVDLAPHSELKASAEKKLTLRTGELHAFIWAPAREFVVDTPSARAVDLGCEYTLNVDPKGDGLLRVNLGWVAFQVGDREAFIPAGAQCATRRKSGPGIPYFEDAPAALRESVAAYEHGDRQALNAVLAAARPRDGLTLWHLLTQAPEPDRGAVFDRFRALVPLPPGVTREGVVRRDAQMIDQCWNALELENTGWWRGWERRWSE